MRKTQCFVKENYSNYIRIYTDGSCLYNNSSAAAFCVPELSVTAFHHCSKYSTPLFTELFAIFGTLKFIIHHRLINTVIFTDSLKAIHSIKFKRDKDYISITLDILSLIFSEKIGHISLCWIPAHIGLDGNEEADAIAKTHANTSNNIDTHSIEFLCDFSQIGTFIKSLTLSEWQNHWTSNKSGRELFKIFPNIKRPEFASIANKFKEISFNKLRRLHAEVNSCLF